MPSAGSFYEFVREERMFCATLAHLLLQKGPNLRTFLELVNSNIKDYAYDTSDLERAEIYLEFTYLRDDWDRLGRGPSSNESKRRRISELLRLADLSAVADRVETLGTESALNAFFMGERGKRITNNIAYPGQWSVLQLSKALDGPSMEFRRSCMFKWAFNIKPDMVIELPGQRPLCVEAKLESREGQYPTTDKELDLFKGIDLVKQIELQKFMFRYLLDRPCVTIMINKNGSESGDPPSISWQHVFKNMNYDSSIPFVAKLTGLNQHLGSQGEEA